MKSLVALSEFHTGAWQLSLPRDICNMGTNPRGQPSRKIMNFQMEGIYSWVESRGHGAPLTPECSVSTSRQRWRQQQLFSSACLCLGPHS